MIILMCIYTSGSHPGHIHFNSIHIQMWREMFTRWRFGLACVCACGCARPNSKWPNIPQTPNENSRFNFGVGRSVERGAAISKTKRNRFSMFGRIILFLVSLPGDRRLRRLWVFAVRCTDKTGMWKSAFSVCISPLMAIVVAHPARPRATTQKYQMSK